MRKLRPFEWVDWCTLIHWFRITSFSYYGVRLSVIFLQYALSSRAIRENVLRSEWYASVQSIWRPQSKKNGDQIRLVLNLGCPLCGRIFYKRAIKTIERGCLFKLALYQCLWQTCLVYTSRNRYLYKQKAKCSSELSSKTISTVAHFYFTFRECNGLDTICGR